MEMATLVSYNAGMAGSPWKMAAVMLKQLKMKGFKSETLACFFLKGKIEESFFLIMGGNSWCRGVGHKGVMLNQSFFFFF